MVNERKPIPSELRRKLLIESGHQCSIPFCGEKSNLEIHHINQNPSDNRESNLIILCPNHHSLADRGKIDRKSCTAYKDRLNQLANFYQYTSLKENIEYEGIDVEADSLFVKTILSAGRRYMNWRYGKPDASMKIEIAILGLLGIASFVPIIYKPIFLKSVEYSISNFDIGASFFGCFIIIILTVILKRRCIKCGGYFGIELINSKLLDEKEILRTEEYIKMRKILHNTYRCAICNNQYSKKEHEDYNIELNTKNEDIDLF